MITEDVWILDDLLGFEVAEINHADSSMRFVIDKEPLAIVFAVGFTQRRVMGVAPCRWLAVD